MIEFLTALVPLWAMLVLILLAGAAGWFWGRSAVADQRVRTEQAERAASFAAGRMAVQQPATEALTRVLIEQLAVAGSDLPPRDATVDATAIAVDYPPLDLSDAFDVFGTDDEPEEPGDDEQEPPRSGQPAEVFRAAILPRYDWSHTGWDPRSASVSPAATPSPQRFPWGRGLDLLRRVSGWPVAPVRWARWTLASRSWRASARAEVREAAEAARLLGFDPEPTGGMPGGQPSVQPVAPAPEAPPRSRPAQHQPGYRKVWSAVLVDGFRATGAAGRHRVGVAAGALAQRQGRLLALPAGAP